MLKWLIIEIISFHAAFAVTSKSCPQLYEGPSLQFVEAPGQLIETVDANPLTCKHIFECNVMTAPSESTIYWYKNNKIIHATVTKDITLNNIHQKTASPVLGISEQRHRLCLDSFIDDKKDNIEFKCRVQSVCDPRMTVESDPLLFQPNTQISNSLLFMNRYYKAPTISLISSSRLEFAGKFVQLFCNAVGSPKPEITWQVIDNNDENILYDIDLYPFVWKLANGSIVIDTMKTADASMAFQCTAKNKFGSEMAQASVILVDGN